MMQPGWKVFFQGAMFGLMVLPFTVAVGKHDWFYAIFFFNIMFAAFYFGGKNADDLRHIGKEGPFFYANLIRKLAKQQPYRTQPFSKVALEVAARAIIRGRLLTEGEKANAIIQAISRDDDEPGPEAA